MNEIDTKNKYDNRPIGFFDSGVGGLTVLNQVVKFLPDEKYIYFGDTKNMPYGEKSESQLLEFADKIFGFFVRKNVKAVVMACNTTSAVTYEKLKDKYPFKIYPIIQTVSKVLSKTDFDCIGIFATPATINSHCYSKEINKQNSKIKVVEIPAKDWVRFVENSQINTKECESSVKIKLDEMFKYNPSKIILGCTHYPYLTKVLSKFAPVEIFIDPSVYFAQAIKDDLINNNILSDSKNSRFEFFVSANPDSFKTAGTTFFNLKNKTIKEIRL